MIDDDDDEAKHHWKSDDVLMMLWRWFLAGFPLLQIICVFGHFKLSQKYSFIKVHKFLQFLQVK